MASILYRVQTREDPRDRDGVLFIVRSRKPNHEDYKAWAEKLTVEYGTTICAIYEVSDHGAHPARHVPLFETFSYKENREKMLARCEEISDADITLYEVSRCYDEMMRYMEGVAKDFEYTAQRLRKHADTVAAESHLYVFKNRDSNIFAGYAGRFMEESTRNHGQDLRYMVTAAARLESAVGHCQPAIEMRVKDVGYDCCDAESPLFSVVPSGDSWGKASIVCARCGEELPSVPYPELPAVREALHEEVEE